MDYLKNLQEGVQDGTIGYKQLLVAAAVVVVSLFLLIRKKKPEGSKWTSKFVLDKYCLNLGHDLKGKTAIVTGGNTGLGLETCKALAYAGCRVIMCSRKISAGEKAVEGEIKKNGDSEYYVAEPNIVVKELDLDDLRSVKRCADEILSKELRIDFLICNAGVMLIKDREVTKDGFERNMGVNHMGHAYLINLLLPKMKQQLHESRIVCLASSAHTYCQVDKFVEDFHYKERKYNQWSAYGASKMANILYAKALQNKLADEAPKVVVCSVHPGVIASDLWRRWNKVVMWVLLPLITDKTVAQGAATSLYACLYDRSEELRGQYLFDCAVGLPNKVGQDEGKILQLALYQKTQEELNAKTKNF